MSLTGLPLFVLLVAFAILIPLALVLTWSGRPHGLLGRALRFIAMVVAQVTAVAAVGVWANNTFGFYDSWADLLGGSQAGALQQSAASERDRRARYHAHCERESLKSQRNCPGLASASTLSPPSRPRDFRCC